MDSKKSLHTIQVPSTSFEGDAKLCGNTLQFQFYRDGSLVRSGIRFVTISAARTRSERCCTPWHIDGVYDTLVEIENSSWVKEVSADTSERYRSKSQSHHFMIYLDSAGCFEIVAESWNAIPEEPGAWPKS